MTAAKSNTPWSVKGIERDARETAKEAAAREGMTVGAWLNQMIYTVGDPKRSGGAVDGLRLKDIVTAIEALNARLAKAETVNGESLQSLTRNVGGVVERLQRLERVNANPASSAAIAERLDGLEEKVNDRQRIDAIKALEKAVASVALQFETAHKESLDRLDTQERQLQQLAGRLENAESDPEAASAINYLKNAVDGLAARISRTERLASEAARMNSDAAAAPDPEFVERTGKRLRILGDEIKRGGDQIRSLENTIVKLSSQIDAAEKRSAEGVQKVSETLVDMRRQLESEEAASEEADRQSIEAAMAAATEHADARIAELQQSFEDMVAQIETTNAGNRAAALAAAKPRQATAPLSGAAQAASLDDVLNDDAFFDDGLDDGAVNGDAVTADAESQDDIGAREEDALFDLDEDAFADKRRASDRDAHIDLDDDEADYDADHDGAAASGRDTLTTDDFQDDFDELEGLLDTDAGAAQGTAPSDDAVFSALDDQAGSGEATTDSTAGDILQEVRDAFAGPAAAAPDDAFEAEYAALETDFDDAPGAAAAPKPARRKSAEAPTDLDAVLAELEQMGFREERYDDVDYGDQDADSVADDGVGDPTNGGDAIDDFLDVPFDGEDASSSQQNHKNASPDPAAQADEKADDQAVAPTGKRPDDFIKAARIAARQKASEDAEAATKKKRLSPKQRAILAARVKRKRAEAAKAAAVKQAIATDGESIAPSGDDEREEDALRRKKRKAAAKAKAKRALKGAPEQDENLEFIDDDGAQDDYPDVMSAIEARQETSLADKIGGALAGLKSRMPGGARDAAQSADDDAEEDAPLSKGKSALKGAAKATAKTAGKLSDNAEDVAFFEDETDADENDAVDAAGNLMARPLTLGLGAAVLLAIVALVFISKDTLFPAAQPPEARIAVNPQAAQPATQTPAQASVQTSGQISGQVPAPSSLPAAPGVSGETRLSAQPAPQSEAPDPAAIGAAVNPRDLYLESVAALKLATTPDAEAAALQQLREAAALGHPPAQLQLGELYKTGQGLAEDPVQARAWYERAANGGNILAMHRIGVMSAQGDGGAADLNAAISWFEQAGNRGLVDSQYNLGTIFHTNATRNTASVEDAGQAYYWYSLAAKNGDDQAGSLAAGLVSNLDTERKAALDAAVANWSATAVNAAANELSPAS